MSLRVDQTRVSPESAILAGAIFYAARDMKSLNDKSVEELAVDAIESLRSNGWRLVKDPPKTMGVMAAAQARVDDALGRGRFSVVELFFKNEWTAILCESTPSGLSNRGLAIYDPRAAVVHGVGPSVRHALSVAIAEARGALAGV